MTSRTKTFPPVLPARDALVWHYTSTAGFEGIVRHKKLWATNAEFFNDASELKHGAAMLQRAYDHDSALAPGAPLHSPNQLARAVQGSVDVQRVGPAPYVTCFCEEDDLLSQWRGYSPGQGYALGFRVGDVQTLISQVGGQLLAVCYLGADDDPPTPRTSNAPSASPRIDANGILELSPLHQAWFKHDGFCEEREVRLVFTEDSATALPDVQFRVGALGMIPYIEVPLTGDGMSIQPEKVQISPGPNAQLRKGAAEQFLSANDWVNVEVVESDIPFR